jgi:hypothetical protein
MVRCLSDIWIEISYSLFAGPYIYQFDASGKMISAIRPPNALIPTRNGTER